MKLTDIENLSLEELKAGKDNLIAEAQKQPSSELAARYIQARIDAKARDVSLAEHAKQAAEKDAVITALTSGTASLEAKVADLQAALTVANFDLVKVAGEVHDARAQFELSREATRKECARGDRFKSQALRSQSALSGAAKLLNDALSAQAIETAETGA